MASWLSVAAVGRTTLKVGNFQRLTDFERVCTGIALSGTTGLRACASLTIFAICCYYDDRTIVINPDCAFMESPIFFGVCAVAYLVEMMVDKFYDGRMFLQPIQAPLKFLMAALVAMATMPHKYGGWANVGVVFMDMIVAMVGHVLSRAYSQGYFDIADHYEFHRGYVTLLSSLLEDLLALVLCLMAVLVPKLAIGIAMGLLLCVVINSVYICLFAIQKRRLDPYKKVGREKMVELGREIREEVEQLLKTKETVREHTLAGLQEGKEIKDSSVKQLKKGAKVVDGQPVDTADAGDKV